MQKQLYLYAFVAALGGMLFGFDTAVISGVIPFITVFFQMSDAQLGWAVSSALAGCVVGALFIGRPGDVYGRKSMLKFMGLLFLVSALGTGLTVNFSMFILFRFIGGIAVGGASVLSPMYISEISPPKIRGRLVSLNQLAIVIGILSAFFSNYLLMDIGVNNWRWMFLAEGIPALLFFSLLFTVSRSPRWLVKKGLYDEAESVIREVNPESDVDRVLQDIKQSIDQEVINKTVFLFKKPYLRLVLIGIAFGMFNQFTGINIIMYYAPSIFKSAGFSNNSALMQTVVLGTTIFVFTLIAMSIIDRLGRKFLLIIGAIGMSGFLGLFSFAYLLEAFNGYYLLIFLVGFLAFFASSQGVVIWVLLSEMFPNNIRARGLAIGSFSHWFFNALTAFLFPIAASTFGIGYVFMFYTICTVSSLFFYIRSLVETKSRSLEELEKILVRK